MCQPDITKTTTHLIAKKVRKIGIGFTKFVVFVKFVKFVKFVNLSITNAYAIRIFEIFIYNKFGILTVYFYNGITFIFDYIL